MPKLPVAPEAPIDESVPSTPTPPVRRVSPSYGMIGRRYDTPDTRLDRRIGEMCEDWRLARVRAMLDGTKAGVDETLKKK